MFNVEIDDRYIVTQEGTSEGTQKKYKKGDYWYKIILQRFLHSTE